MLFCDYADFLVIERMPVQVDSKCGLGFSCNFFFNFFWVYIECVWLYVGKYRDCSLHQNAACRSDKSKRCSYDFIAFFYAKCIQGAMKCRSAGICGNCMCRFAICGKIVLKFHDFVPLRKIA